MLKNQNIESSFTQTKKYTHQPKMHNLTPLTPYNQNISIPMIKKLGKFEFSLDQKLGSGMAGDAYVGINTQNDELVCVKVIDKQLFKTQQQKTMLQHQICCQKLIQCENTIKIFEVFDQNPFCFIVTEFCEGGDLYQMIRYSIDGLPQQLVRKFGFEVAKALLKLKQMRIIHRDIKPQNILLRKQSAKLGDFGFAIEEKDLQNKDELNIGSPLYMSLQALENNEYSYASDIFSYGVVLYEMLHKVSPWECNDEYVLREKMRSQPVRFKEGLSAEVKDLIVRCLKIKGEERISIEEVVEHEFFNGLNTEMSERGPKGYDLTATNQKLEQGQIVEEQERQFESNQSQNLIKSQ